MSSTSTTDSSHDEASDQENAIAAKKALLKKDQEAIPEQEQQGDSIPELQPIAQDLAPQESSNGQDADGQVSSTPQTNGHDAESERPQTETGLKADYEEARQQPEETSSEQSQQKKASFSPAKGSMFATFQQHFANPT